MRQVAFAEDPGESRGSRRSSLREAPGQTRRPLPFVQRPFNRMIAFLSKYEGNVHSLCPFSPVASNLETPSSLWCREFRRMPGGKAKCHPLSKL